MDATYFRNHFAFLSFIPERPQRNDVSTGRYFMEFALLERLKEAAEAIHSPKSDKIQFKSARQTEDRKTEQRRAFATLMRSIKTEVREVA
jgi:hypothetical protein